MFQLKSLSPEGIVAALEKAERYRLLNEPDQAESICDDILAIDPDNQAALVMLLLALTDQFRGGPAECFGKAQAVLPRLSGEYERAYYSGINCERRGYALLLKGTLGSRPSAAEWVRQAMAFYEQAEPLRPAGNDDALLRWNHCLRLCQRYQLDQQVEEPMEPAVEGE